MLGTYLVQVIPKPTPIFLPHVPNQVAAIIIYSSVRSLFYTPLKITEPWWIFTQQLYIKLYRYPSMQATYHT